MTARQKKASVATLAAAGGAAVGALGLWGTQQAVARDDGRERGSITARVERNERDIGDLRTEFGMFRAMFGEIDRSLGRIEGKLGIEAE